MSERKKASAAGGSSTSSSPQKKKARPPPVEVADSGSIPLPPPSFALPTMRGAGLYNHQQIIVTPAAQLWDVQEQGQLERLHRVLCYPNESLLNKSIKIAAHLSKKTVRDVACRLTAMEESTVVSTRPEDEVTRMLNRNDAIIAELQQVPSRARTDEEEAKLKTLLNEFVNVARQSRTKLEQKDLKVPLQLVPIPQIPEAFRLGTDSGSSS